MFETLKKIFRKTATRLDRFKKAEHWSQRRVEEGFACDAAAFSANRKAITEWENLLRRLDIVETEIYRQNLVLAKGLDSFAGIITSGPGNEFDKIGGLTCIHRLHWIEKPEIESWKFEYDPVWLEDDKLANLWHLLWNYEETDAGLRERIKQHHGVK
jgi:hypothetical protein